MYSRAKIIANTFRFDRDSGIEYFASLHMNDSGFVSSTFVTQKVVDKVGSGDCFMAGLIYGIKNQHAGQQIIDFAAAAAFDKLQQTGDSSSSRIDDIQNLIAAHG
jgi:2-dehydro-3-deoxygluconokinase